MKLRKSLLLFLLFSSPSSSFGLLSSNYSDDFYYNVYIPESSKIRARLKNKLDISSFINVKEYPRLLNLGMNFSLNLAP